MRTYELAHTIYQDLSPLAPRLAAAVNRALLDIGDSPSIITLPGVAGNMRFQESETIRLKGGDPADILFRITQALVRLEESTSWRVILDKQPGSDRDLLELTYTFVREAER